MIMPSRNRLSNSTQPDLDRLASQAHALMVHHLLETRMAEAKAADIATMSFEDALRELEGIVHKLEAGDVPLEDSIRIYERGAALKAHCEKRLKEAELKVEKVVLGADGPMGLESAMISGRDFRAAGTGRACGRRQEHADLIWLWSILPCGAAVEPGVADRVAVALDRLTSRRRRGPRRSWCAPCVMVRLGEGERLRPFVARRGSRPHVRCAGDRAACAAGRRRRVPARLCADPRRPCRAWTTAIFAAARPTVHKAFDEADSRSRRETPLQALAFEIMVSPETGRRCRPCVASVR